MAGSGGVGELNLGTKLAGREGEWSVDEARAQ